MEENKSGEHQISAYPAIIAIIVLLLALLSWPYGYYVFLRWVVCGVAVVYAYSRYSVTEKLDGWFLVLAVMAILYNPIIPVYLYDKSIWSVLNVITALLMLLVSGNKRLNSRL